MTPDQERKLNEVYDFIQNLQDWTRIPRDVETAFSERLGSLQGIANSTPPVPTSFSSFPVSVPVAPTKTITVNFKGAIYNILCI